ncbi:MAG: putative transport system permease protein, partial [Rhodospirillaceae bacterium]|nr:putative transport system permease protein [Rhodospirillaceae bacterium]
WSVWSMAVSSRLDRLAGSGPVPGLPLAWRLAGRELRGGLRGFRLFLFCLALGVALIAGVGSLAEAIRVGLARDARALLGGDVELSLLYRPASAAQLQAFAAAGRVSALRTLRAMARSGNGPERRLVELKTADAAYPLFGQAVLAPDQPLATALANRDGRWGAVADPGVLDRLGLKLGDTVKIGSVEYQIRAVIEREPDRGAAVFLFGPRMMVADASLDATGLIQPGSLVYHHYRIAYGGGVDGPAWLKELNRRFPDAGWRVRGLDQAAPGVKRFVDRTALFLTLVGLSALLVGGIGVGNAVKAYLEAKTTTIAILKCLGAPSRSIFALYLSLILLLACGGALIGLVLGAAVPFVAAAPLAANFSLDLATGVYPLPLAAAAGFGLLIAFGFSLPALMRARDLPPGQLFRDMLGHARGGRRRRLGDAALLAIVVLLLIALTLAATGDRWLAAWFAGATLVTLIVFRLLGAAVMAAARPLARRQRGTLRRALADLAGPAAPTPTVVLALGLGLTVLVAVAMIEGNLRRELAETMPAAAPSFFFIDIQPGQAAAFDALVRAHPGVSDLERVPMLRGRIVGMKGVPAEKLKTPHNMGWVLQGDRGITWAANLPRGSRLVEGSWWPADYRGPPLISLDAEVAEAFDLKLGDSLTVNVLGREITGKIANLRRFDWATLTINFIMVFSPGILEAAPQTHIATLRVDPAEELALERQVTDRFANVSAIRVREALASAERMLGAMTRAVAATAAVALIAGIAVLAGAVVADRRRRIYDAVVLKVLGATRRDVLAGLALEYGVLGLVTAVIALLLGSLAAYGFVRWGMEGNFVLLPGVALMTAAAGTGLAILIGLAGTWRALGEKPAPLLRNE